MSYPNMCCEVDPREQLEAMKAKCEFEKAGGRPVCNGEPSIKTRLKEIEKRQIDTRCLLMNIIEGITNAPRPNDELPDENCVNDTVDFMDKLSSDNLAMVNRIFELIFA